MRSSRWDAQGNVYLVVDGEDLTPERVRANVADTDGMLEVFSHGEDWIDIAIWNPDGSRAEMSGNGTRIAGAWLMERSGATDVRVVEPGVIEARVWERGAKETASSGSSAVAIAAAFGMSPATIRFPGGELLVRIEDGRAFLTGPAIRLL